MQAATWVGPAERPRACVMRRGWGLNRSGAPAATSSCAPLRPLLEAGSALLRSPAPTTSSPPAGAPDPRASPASACLPGCLGAVPPASAPGPTGLRAPGPTGLRAPGRAPAPSAPAPMPRPALAPPLGSGSGPLAAPPPPRPSGASGALAPPPCTAPPSAAARAGTRPSCSASAHSVGLARRRPDPVSGSHVKSGGLRTLRHRPWHTQADAETGFHAALPAAPAPAGPLHERLPADRLQRRPQPRAQRRGQALKLCARDVRAQRRPALQDRQGHGRALGAAQRALGRLGRLRQARHGRRVAPGRTRAHGLTCARHQRQQFLLATIVCNPGTRWVRRHCLAPPARLGDLRRLRWPRPAGLPPRMCAPTAWLQMGRHDHPRWQRQAQTARSAGRRRGDAPRVRGRRRGGLRKGGAGPAAGLRAAAPPAGQPRQQRAVPVVAAQPRVAARCDHLARDSLAQVAQIGG